LASACQTSTSAPGIGSHVVASITVRRRASGTPGRFSVMSRRVSLLSIQYGPR